MKKLFEGMKNFIKREPVLFAALLLAVLAVCLIRPGVELCLQAIDCRPLATIFSVMIVMEGFESQNLLEVIAAGRL